jgi:hypothetical protein
MMKTAVKDQEGERCETMICEKWVVIICQQQSLYIDVCVQACEEKTLHYIRFAEGISTYVYLHMTFAVISWSLLAVSNLHTTAVKYCIIGW